MSSAFLKNETAEDPVFIPARAPLPPGATNYVTPRGLALLRAELTELEAQHAQVQANDSEASGRMRQLAEINGRIGLLNQRIATAKVVESHAQPANEVRFGATVTLRTVSSTNNTQKTMETERRLTIVGVDEADASHGLIAFTAPIARAMQGKQIGDIVTLRMGRGEDIMEVINILYKDV